MYTDSAPVEGAPYCVLDGLGILNGIMSPHFNERAEFEDIAKSYEIAYAVDNNSAIIFEDGVPVKALSSGGASYIFRNGVKTKLD